MPWACCWPPPCFGYLGSRFGCKPIMLAGVALSALTVVIFWSAPSYGLLQAARFCQGKGGVAFLQHAEGALQLPPGGIRKPLGQEPRAQPGEGENQACRDPGGGRGECPQGDAGYPRRQTGPGRGTADEQSFDSADVLNQAFDRIHEFTRHRTKRLLVVEDNLIEQQSGD